ncbi:MAG: DNA polymerase Y family protein [Candidatus Dormibacteria bacterium]
MDKPVACVLLPDLRLCLAWRARLALRERPLVVGGYPWERGEVAAACPRALEDGVRVGMGLRQAEQLCPGATFMPVPPGAAAAWSSLTWRLYDSTCDLEPTWPHGFWLHLDHLELVHGGTGPALRHLAGVFERELEVSPRVGIARSRFAAALAAQVAEPGHARRVAPGKEAGFLAGFSLARLAEDPELQRLCPRFEELREEWRALGWERLGDLARVPLNTLAARFGPAGRRAGRLCRGSDGSRLSAWSPPETRTWAMSFEPPLDDRAALAFALRRGGVELGEWLAGEGLGAQGYRLRLELEGFPPLEVEREVSGQARGAEELARACQSAALQLEVPGPVSGMELRLLRLAPAASRQLSLLVRRDGVTEDIEAAAARLSERHGQSLLLRPVMNPGRPLLPERQARLCPVNP